MAIQFQYNKMSLGELDKQLRMRIKALPTVKSKESALRMEVKRAREEASEYERRLGELNDRYEYMTTLWNEFDPGLIAVKDVVPTFSKIAGVRIPHLKEVVFEEKEFDIFSSPAWIADGIGILREFASLRIEYEFFRYKSQLLEQARKKTTQKVNLYEKVQIPGYEDAIRKIKRYLEDNENLSKSSQKIVKTRQMTLAGEGRRL